MDVFLIYGGLPPKYQCTEESKTEGPPNIAIGIYCIVFGAVFIPLHFLCLTALVQRDLRAMPVYKIMIFLSICDITKLASNSLITGVFFIKGTVFCSYPVQMYILGCIMNSCWGASCFGCLCLVFTRLVYLWSHQWHEVLFGGKKAIIVILLCVAYASCFFFFPSPGFFNVNYYSWIYDPMVDDSKEVFEVKSAWIIAANNLLTVTSTVALYIVFFLSFLFKYHLSHSYQMASYEKQMFVQSIAISGVNLVLALIYVYMLYFPMTFSLTIAGLIFWQLSSAGAVIVYLGINRTVRKKVVRTIFKRKKKRFTTVSVIFS